MLKANIVIIVVAKIMDLFLFLFNIFPFSSISYERLSVRLPDGFLKILSLSIYFTCRFVAYSLDKEHYGEAHSSM